MKPIPVSHYTLTSALGRGRAAQLQALLDERGGLTDRPFRHCELATWTGQVDGLAVPVAADHRAWDCRANRLASAALQQDGFVEAVAALRRRYGARRIGLFVGTSAGGVEVSEAAYRARDRSVDARLEPPFDARVANTYTPAGYLRQRLELEGICIAISTACTSAAKVFASAARAIECGWCDAAVVAGVEALCMSTLYGFNSLQLLSRNPCRPADPARDGLSIGEAAGFAILDPRADAPLALLGYGESSDAHHMSAPDPAGRGARLAIDGALSRAGLTADRIEYINLHGTATQANDRAEDAVVVSCFGTGTPCSSTKGWTGHTLGAAGIVEAVLSLICIEDGLLPRSLNTTQKDPALSADIVMRTRRAPLRHVLSNSFGFGGSNVCLVLGRP
nr:beta-ketoacyl-ACP synthase [Panacagrimonas sp.]